jgi:thioester reductase-like protein
MATPTIFFTGFPGFLGVELLPRVLRRNPDAQAVCLVQPKFLEVARDRVTDLEKTDADLVGRIRLVPGDITEPDLGLDADHADLAETTTEIFHLAAVYDLAVAEDLAMRVNVDGTRHVTEFARRCDNLARYQYVSTCYVSGRYAGPWRESDLQVEGQVFANHYDRTKHLAEVIVREAADTHGLPTTIYRPSVVNGDSRTGETQKLDGPYYVAKLLLKQKGPVAIMPIVGSPDVFRFNLVPRDVVVDGIAHLSGLATSSGVTYALANPNPPTITELVDTFAEAAGKRVVKVRLPQRPAVSLVDRVGPVQRLMEFPAEAIPYFAHPTHYLTDNADRDLAGTGIEVPHFRDYIPRLVEFTRAHMDMTSAAMV